ncbi:hypothetical protein DICVIV_08220 [Dictyocaulus viviparus]|uniref:Uncharacterized protein n=1 Tax=Dictyocaulus viviparus TaxID=29172 RepID=A0A0D8XMK2_DICVI|nr:hypothetical protein DICVIV_08220 [Dictyocaulus viviparus]
MQLHNSKLLPEYYYTFGEVIDETPPRYLNDEIDSFSSLRLLHSLTEMIFIDSFSVMRLALLIFIKMSSVSVFARRLIHWTTSVSFASLITVQTLIYNVPSLRKQSSFGSFAEYIPGYNKRAFDTLAAPGFIAFDKRAFDSLEFIGTLDSLKKGLKLIEGPIKNLSILSQRLIIKQSLMFLNRLRVSFSHLQIYTIHSKTQKYAGQGFGAFNKRALYDLIDESNILEEPSRHAPNNEIDPRHRAVPLSMLSIVTQTLEGRIPAVFSSLKISGLRRERRNRKYVHVKFHRNIR